MAGVSHETAHANGLMGHVAITVKCATLWRTQIRGCDSSIDSCSWQLSILHAAPHFAAFQSPDSAVACVDSLGYFELIGELPRKNDNRAALLLCFGTCADEPVHMMTTGYISCNDQTYVCDAPQVTIEGIFSVCCGDSAARSCARLVK